MYSLLATTGNQIRNGPLALLNARFHRGSATNRAVNLAEIVIREMEGNRSLKVFQLLAECVREASQPAAVHPQGVILLFNVRRGNQRDVRLSRNNVALGLNHFRRAIPAGRFLHTTEM